MPPGSDRGGRHGRRNPYLPATTRFKSLLGT
jgi:hypothetical protein